jgi:hypothetical protein
MKILMIDPRISRINVNTTNTAIKPMGLSKFLHTTGVFSSWIPRDPTTSKMRIHEERKKRTMEARNEINPGPGL